MAADEDRKRGARLVFGTKIRTHAGTDPLANARGSGDESIESRGNRPNTETL